MINFQFTQDQIEITDRTYNLVEQLMIIAKYARREGLLSLLDYIYSYEDKNPQLKIENISKEEHSFIMTMLRIITNAFDGEDAKGIIKYHVQSIPKDNKELYFSYMLIGEWALMLQSGGFQVILAEMFASMFGYEQSPKLLKFLEEKGLYEEL